MRELQFVSEPVKPFAGRGRTTSGVTAVCRAVPDGSLLSLDFTITLIDHRLTTQHSAFQRSGPMSLLLTASNLLERLKQRTTTSTPTGLVEPPPVKETPRQVRDRLRQEIRGRGGKPEEQGVFRPLRQRLPTRHYLISASPPAARHPLAVDQKH